MKKKGLFILLGLVCIAVVAGSGFLVVTRDKTGPEITVSEDRKITYEMGGDKKALLDGVKAIVGIFNEEYANEIRGDWVG